MARIMGADSRSGGSRVDAVFARLRAEILSGRYAPGMPLRTAALAKEHAVSLSVIRESLVRLVENGLAESHPHQGFKVVSISREDLIDLTEVRILVETQVLSRSIALADVTWEAQVLSAHHVLESIPVGGVDVATGAEEWALAHEAFHDALGLGSGSPRLIALARSLRDSSEIYRQLSGPRGAETGRDIRAEHRRIMELATARDVAGATAALSDHLNCTTSLLLEHVIPDKAEESGTRK